MQWLRAAAIFGREVSTPVEEGLRDFGYVGRRRHVQRGVACVHVMRDCFEEIWIWILPACADHTPADIGLMALVWSPLATMLTPGVFSSSMVTAGQLPLLKVVGSKPRTELWKNERVPEPDCGQ